MAVLGSILYKRTLKQFLDCDDLESDKARSLIEKLRDASKDSVEQLILSIAETSGSHQAVLTEICLENVEGSNEELFLDNLDHDVTEIRSATASILSQATQLSPGKLFKKLHEPTALKSEIINILAAQRERLVPEQVIANSLKLNQTHAEQLLALVPDSKIPLNLEVLRADPETISSPAVKIMLLRYFAQVEQAGIARVIARFLNEDNKTVVMEALKALRSLEVKFDASILLPHIESMSEAERGLALEVLQKQADADLVPRFGPWTCGKDEEIREVFIKLFVEYVTPKGLETFLGLLDQQEEWWGKEQSLKCLHKHGNDELYSAAEGLTSHQNQFVSEQAQKLAAMGTKPADLKELWINSLHENWDVRERAIEMLGQSGQREAIGILKRVIKKKPESSPSVLKAVSNLGYTKGLEIAFDCLRMSEAQVQREALEAIGKLANKRHAKVIRNKLVQKVPKLQVVVRDTAGEVINRLTEEFDLSELNIDQETYFDTRLIKFDDTQTLGGSSEPAQAPPTYQSMEDFKEGDIWLERYRIGREIGRGAMGRVMLATDEMVGETVVLKFMHPELTAEKSTLERFLREVKYSRKVSHPNVIRIHDMLSRDNLCAISMEYFESIGIDEYLSEKKRCEPGEALEILLQVANGMAAAHNQNVIHRDLKPSNILINDEGLVKIVDFGIASASTSVDDATLTKAGSIVGTPAYLSPERAKGQEADHRSDIYALGIIAYGMLHGKLPYSGEPMSLMFQHIEGKAKPLYEVRPEVGEPVSQLVQHMMVVKAKHRLQTMEDVAAEIKEVQQKLA